MLNGLERKMDDRVVAEELLKYLLKYTAHYREEAKRLTQDPPAGAGYPPNLLPRTFLESPLIRAYLLKDGVAINDEGLGPEEDWWSTPGLYSVLHFTGPRDVLVVERLSGRQAASDCMPDGTRIEVVRMDDTVTSFVKALSLGIFRFADEPRKRDEEFRRSNVCAMLGFTNAHTPDHRFITYLAIYGYVDPAGWDPRGAWLRAFHDVRYDLASAITRLELATKPRSIVAVPDGVTWAAFNSLGQLGLKIAQFDKDISSLEELLYTKPKQEQTFQQFLEEHPHLLDLYALSVVPQPFLPIPEKGKRGRFPDFLIKHSDLTYTLVEIERPNKPLFTTGGDPQITAMTTQALNQISMWRDIIRRYGSTHLTDYPGIEHNKGLLIAGRATAKEFGTYPEFQRTLNRINAELKDIRIITFDEVVLRAKIALTRLAALAIPVSEGTP